MVRRLVLGLVLAGLVATPVTAGAAPSLLGPTGLVLTPTADTLGMTQWAVGVAGVSADDGPDVSLGCVSLGVGAGLEVGLTREKLEGADAETLVNAKLAIIRPPVGEVAVPVGMIDIGDEVERTTYIVLSHTLGAGVVRKVGPVALPQVHVGVGDGMLDGMFVGLSTVVGDRATLMAEYDGDQVNVGARFPLLSKLEATLAALDGAKDLGAAITFSSPW